MIGTELADGVGRGQANARHLVVQALDQRGNRGSGARPHGRQGVSDGLANVFILVIHRLDQRVSGGVG